jgi:multiple sugar transport system substrate-binding protein
VTRHGQPTPPRGRIYAAAGALVVVLIIAGVVLFGAFPGGGPTITYCSGEDVSGTQGGSVNEFNASDVADGAKAKLVDDFDSAETADAQRAEYFERIGKSECDVVYLDVAYTPEFASKGLLLDMTSFMKKDNREENFDDRMMATVTFDDKLWGVPKQLDGGVIFFRTDAGHAAPETWPQVLDESVPAPGEKPGLRFQLDAYEGLTVVFLELAYAAGAQSIVSADGRTARVDQRGTLAALRFMQEALERRAAPRSVLKTGDAGSFYNFSIGRAKFLRSWPYKEKQFLSTALHAAEVSNGTADSRMKTARNLGVAPLPPWTEGGEKVGVLGGHNLVIPNTSKHREEALRLVEFLTSSEQILADAKQASLYPVLTRLASNPDVQADPALNAVDQIRLEPRPIIPQYADVSRVIYRALRRVLQNGQSRDRLPGELRRVNRQVQDVLNRG